MERSNKPLMPNEISKETKLSMKARVMTGLVLILICLPTIFTGGWFYFTFASLLPSLVSL